MKKGLGRVSQTLPWGKEDECQRPWGKVPGGRKMSLTLLLAGYSGRDAPQTLEPRSVGKSGQRSGTHGSHLCRCDS